MPNILKLQSMEVRNNRSSADSISVTSCDSHSCND
ncbi:class III lanthipeptide [Cytobacillus sp. Hm23]